MRPVTDTPSFAIETIAGLVIMRSLAPFFEAWSIIDARGAHHLEFK
jgi:hypothetical protein